VAQNLADHGVVFNGREDGQGAAALWTGGEVDGEERIVGLGSEPGGSG